MLISGQVIAHQNKMHGLSVIYFRSVGENSCASRPKSLNAKVTLPGFKLLLFWRSIRVPANFASVPWCIPLLLGSFFSSVFAFFSRIFSVGAVPEATVVVLPRLALSVFFPQPATTKVNANMTRRGGMNLIFFITLLLLVE